MFIRSPRWARSIALAATTAVATTVVIAAFATSAFAGTYTVAICDAGWGNVNDALTWTPGWGTIVDAQNCTNGVWGAGKGLQTWTDGLTPNGSSAGYWYHAPAGTSIVGLYAAGQYSGWDGWTAHWATDPTGVNGDPNVETIGCWYESDSYTACNTGSDSSTAVANTSEIGFGLWCHNPAGCPANDSNSTYGPAASINVYKAYITVSEDNPPSVVATGPIWSGGWVSTANGRDSISYYASDPTGICGFRAVVTDLAGTWTSQVNDQSDGVDSSQGLYGNGKPCPDRNWTTWTPNLGALPDGYYLMWPQASNAAGVWANAAGGPVEFGVDDTPPVASISSAPPAQWFNTAQDVSWTASDNLSGVNHLHCSDRTSQPGSAYTMTVGQEGADVVSCYAVDNAGNVQSTPATTVVYIDYQQPTVSFSGPSQTGWLSGPQTVSVSGSEPQPLSGINEIACSVDGGAATDSPGASGSVTVSTNGVHTISCQVLTNAGTWGPSVTYTLHIDSVPPTTAISSDNSRASSQWVPGPVHLTLTCTDQVGLSGCGEIDYQIDDGNVETAPGGSTTVTIADAGAHTVKAWSVDNAGNVGQPVTAEAMVDPNPPGAPAFGPARGWIDATQIKDPETISAQSGGPSGISGYEVAVDSQPTGNPANINSAGSFNISALADGTHQLCAIAYSGAYVAGPSACTTIKINRNPPTTTVTSDAPQAQTGWVGHSVTWTITCTDPPTASGCASISYNVDGGATQTVAGSTATIVLGTSGARTLTAWSTDNAGNGGPSAAAQALVDVTPPQGFFEPPSLSNPQQLVVAAADGQSGVAGGQIQIGVNGAWQSLPTAFDASAGTLSAVARDNQLPRGSWPVRALVWDAVGNQATVTSYANGIAVTHSVPARVQTEILAGIASVPLRTCAVARAASASPQQREGADMRARIRARCKVSEVPHNGGPLRLAYGQAATISGIALTMTGQALADIPILVEAQPPGWPSQEVARLTTSPAGRFSYRLPAGPSRALTFTFSGNNTLGGAAATISVRVQGRATITAGEARAGQPLALSGRVFGGYIPPAGTLIQLQYRVVGFPAGWSPFDVLVRTHANGSWAKTVVLPRTAAGFTYLLRGAIASQSGWPWTGATTNVIARAVSG